MTLDLAPLTFLYGPNSAGKSAVADAIALAADLFGSRADKETAASWAFMRSADSRMVLGIGGRTLGGSLLDQLHVLGLRNWEGYLSDKRLQPALSVATDLFTVDRLDTSGQKEKGADALGMELDVIAELAYSGNEAEPRNFRLDKLTVAIDGVALAQVAANGKTVTINTQHPKFAPGGSLHHFGKNLVRVVTEIRKALPQQYRDVVQIGKSQLAVSCFYTPIEDLGLSDRFTVASPGFRPAGDSWWNDHALDSEEDLYRLLQRIADVELERRVDRLREFFCGLISIPARIAGAAAQGLLRLGPLRDLPAASELIDLPTTIAPRDIDDRFRPAGRDWQTGRASWAELAERSRETVQKINTWLAAPDHLDMGFELRIARYSLDFDEDQGKRPLPLGYPQDEQPYALIYLWDLKLQQPVAVADVGTGVSQVVPVLVAGNSKRATVFVEQPELHLHPRLVQSLGDFFIANRYRGLRVVETHSEHIALRMLRRIRETSNGKVRKADLALRPDEVAFYYFEPNGGATKVRRLRVDAQGRFVDRWPKGFFDERAEDLFDAAD